MQHAHSHDRSTAVWLPLAFMFATLLLRVLGQHHILDGWPNLSPLMALAFTGAVLFPKPLPWWSWAAILLVMDWFSEGSNWWRQADGHLEVLLAYGCYAFAAWWGASLRGRVGVVETVLGTLACSVLFYLVTNSLCWWIKPDYAKDFGGWVQCLSTGLPNVHPTTLEFFRNSLIADLAGSIILLIIYNAEAIARQLRTIPWLGRFAPQQASA